MNKKQKQLINTYLRKREIAYRGQRHSYNNPYDFFSHEISYKIKNNINTHNITKQKILDAISYDKSIINHISDNFFNDLNSTQIVYLLAYEYPELIDKFSDEALSNLDTIGVSTLLSIHPHMIDKLPLQNLNDEYVINILSEHPELINRLPLEEIKENLNNDYFREYTLKQLEKLFKIQPHLRKKFRQKGII